MELVYKKDGFITKLFACVLIAMFVVMCLVGNIVFASNDDGSLSFDEVPGYTDIISQYEHYLIKPTNIGHEAMALYVTNDEIIFYHFSDGGYSVRTKNGGKMPQYIYDPQSTKYTTWFMSSSDISGNSTLNPNDKYFLHHLSNQDIFDQDENLVFQAPPQQVEGEQVLAPIVEGQEMKPLVEILQILPVVILVVVGLIAIRKAIQWIMTTMRRTIKISLKKF